MLLNAPESELELNAPTSENVALFMEFEFELKIHLVTWQGKF
jgi:hypothetical protein